MRSVFVGQDDPSPDAGSITARNTRPADLLIRLREAVLDAITRTKPAGVLNGGNSSDNDSREAGMDLPTELKRFLDMAKSQAMDDTGLSVDYESLRGSRLYGEYRQSCSPRLKYFDPQQLNRKQEKLAFWINLYNALVLDGVIAKGVTESVASSPLKLLAFFRQTSYNVGGQRMSCDDIEHGVLRGNRGHPMLPGRQFPSSDSRNSWLVSPPDARIHFALNCASRSCPPIQVYSADELDTQLDLAARNFVNTDMMIDPERRAAHLSAIFSWYQLDFGGREGVIDFLLKYLTEDDRRSWLEDHRASIQFRYKDYDWGLNSRYHV
jgi:hypothetical protein